MTPAYNPSDDLFPPLRRQVHDEAAFNRWIEELERTHAKTETIVETQDQDQDQATPAF